MTQSMIMPCNCKHGYQDKVYGKGQRVHNRRMKIPGWRCTVCGTDKGAPPQKR